MTKEVTVKHKNLASSIAGIFGVQKPSIARFADEKGGSDIFILEAKNSPNLGVNSFSTIGLSDIPLFFKGSEFGARVEIVGACDASFHRFAEAISTAAFCVINSHWFCAPGMIFPSVIGIHGISTTMSDIYFANPFLWPELKTINIEGKDIAWLLAVPVSKAETEFAQKNGPEKLESLFSERNIDIFNLNRTSIV
ncbi:MAG: suppressor of fused domain protein [Acidovorax sp.]|nr:suppressor of fused domain protein [Acidovorax sp.]